jgi:CMP-N,N'-diacetyllegionaminic acid synthase
MSRTIALVPAKSRSTGIPSKNWRPLAGGLSCVDLALLCARQADIPAIDIYLSTDAEYPEEPPHPDIACRVLKRPAELAQDDTPMLAVVQHALQQLPGAEDDIILLLQPTQPFRTPEHLREAVRLLLDTQAESVVSVVELPLTHSPDMLGLIVGNRLAPWNEQGWPTRRQEATPAYKRDGTIYAFWRRTVSTHGSIYGYDVRPLIIPPEQSCSLDTEDEWREVERRWKERT